MQLQLPKGEYRAFIYDCDGTLADSMPLHHVAWQTALRRSGARFEFDWALFVSRAGMGLFETVIELNRQFEHALDPGQVVTEQRRSFMSQLPSLEPIASVVEHARAVRGKAPQCVASGGERLVVEQELTVLGIRDWFDFIVCPDDVERGKPDPEMFLLCARRMGVSPSECLVFEDGALGIRAAQAAGMAWVAVDGSGRNGCSSTEVVATSVPGSREPEGIPGG